MNFDPLADVVAAIFPGATPPEHHPMTREPFTSCSYVHTAAQVHVVRYLAPAPPEREEVTEWDDDGPTSRHTLSEAEYAEAMVAYERALDVWRQSRGEAVVLDGPDPPAIVTFGTASGALATGVWTGSRWQWREVGRA